LVLKHVIMTYSTTAHVSDSAIDMNASCIQSHLYIILLLASVKFNFDICRLKNDLIDSVNSFEIDDKLGLLIYGYFGAAIFEGGLDVVNEIKTFLQGHAKDEANRIKTEIADQISAISCNRRLTEIEIDEDGTQRLLLQDTSFNDLVDQVRTIFGVQHATAGLDLERMEVGLDVIIHVEKVFDGSLFQSALDSVFGRVANITEVFGTVLKPAALSSLIDEFNVRAIFQVSFSAGVKVDVPFVDFFQGLSSNAAPSVTGFMRINEFNISALAQVDNLSLELFDGINVNAASMTLSLGVGLLERFEFNGNYSDMEVGLNVGQLRFEPHGGLAALFPFSTTISGTTQSLQLIFNDDFFDDKDFSVKMNFNACPFLDVFEQLLGKLGAFDLSPQHILGPDYSLITSIGLDSLDSLFPSVGGFLIGVLEGES